MTGAAGIARDPRGRLPPGWPLAVPPPDAPGWVRGAVAWLFDLCPADYRAYEVLRRHPVVLARVAYGHAEAAEEACRRGLALARGDLSEVAAPAVVEAALSMYEREVGRLGQAARSVLLVEESLRGQRYQPRL
jgi:hypothetical protein